MADKKIGTVIDWKNSSDVLAIFRFMPEAGSKFPSYKAGQYMALQRNDCRLTKKVVGDGGKVDYVTVLDDQGKPKRGPVAHSYSICSAPFETEQKGWLEVYVILEVDEKGMPGRLTESMFRMKPDGDNKMVYYEKIAGDFTLDKRAAGYKNVILVGTGTGLAPFRSMVKQIDFEAASGKNDGVKYTLLHTNRTYEELDYYQELLEIEAAERFDFVYVPSVSRPTERDWDDPKLGRGRANNVLRYLLDLPIKEEQDLQEIAAKGGDTAKAKAVLEKTVKPALPKKFSREALRGRFDPSSTVVITCGNPWSMEDIKYAAEARGMKFEKEDW
jgi:ferredoxin-NADP reductase